MVGKIVIKMSVVEEGNLAWPLTAEASPIHCRFDLLCFYRPSRKFLKFDGLVLTLPHLLSDVIFCLFASFAWAGSSVLLPKMILNKIIKAGSAGEF